eukprot:10452725-Karenia_brevis.AAC.1
MASSSSGHLPQHSHASLSPVLIDASADVDHSHASPSSVLFDASAEAANITDEKDFNPQDLANTSEGVCTKRWSKGGLKVKNSQGYASPVQLEYDLCALLDMHGVQLLPFLKWADAQGIFWKGQSHQEAWDLVLAFLPDYKRTAHPCT